MSERDVTLLIYCEQGGELHVVVFCVGTLQGEEGFTVR